MASDFDDFIKCPFCISGRFFANLKNLSVMHTMPPCETFERLGVVEFVTRARRALGIPAPPEDAN